MVAEGEWDFVAVVWHDGEFLAVGVWLFDWSCVIMGMVDADGTCSSCFTRGEIED